MSAVFAAVELWRPQ